MRESGKIPRIVQVTELEYMFFISVVQVAILGSQQSLIKISVHVGLNVNGSF